MVDFNQYQPPGVYIEENISPSTRGAPPFPSLLAIVGPSRGYRLRDESVILVDEDPSSLSEQGIDSDFITVTDANGDEYEEGVDYEVAQEDGDNPPYTATTTIARLGGSSIESEDRVFVSYRYTDEAFIAPQRFQDADDVRAFYGPAFDAETGEVVSAVTLAARIAFRNDAPEVIVTSTKAEEDLSAEALQEAYARLATRFDVGIVVPLLVGLTGGNLNEATGDLRSHVLGASGEGYFRIGVVGYETDVTDPPEDLASELATRRLVSVAPHRIYYYNGHANETVEVGGYYLAVAVGARLSSRRVQFGVTRQPVRGFAGLPGGVVQTMDRSTRDSWSSAGVTVVEPTRDDRLVVRHGVTTQVDNVMNREISLVRARDSIIFNLEGTLERSGLIGSPIGPTTVLQVKGVVAGVLENLRNSGAIVDYIDLKARQTGSDPTLIEVKFEYQPAYPLNYIVVSFAINVQTGELDIAA